MRYSWSKSVFPIAAIFSFRMLGLFMLIPVFTIYAPELKGATPTLIGIALGSYGLSQGLLQMPFGMLSDKYGRKVIILLGLILFIAGSLLGACTHSIYGMIIARILQGMGAIGSVLIALLADLTPENQRTQSMAVIGMTIGISFSLAMVISPVMTQWVHGLSGIFYLTAFLAVCGLILLFAVIPTPKYERCHLVSIVETSLFKTVLTNPVLLRLNAGIFFQHLILTATFFAIPLLLEEEIKAGTLSGSSHFYLPLMILSFLIMIPCIYYAERKGRGRAVFLLSVFITGIAHCLLVFFYAKWFVFCILMGLYFIAFNILEATLPSLISKRAPPHTKGTAMGAYSSCQFIGIFIGGLLAGVLYQYAGVRGIFTANAVVALIWGCMACTMQWVENK